MSAELFLSSRRVATPEGVRPAVVAIRDGVVKELLASHPRALDFGARVLLPGLVDSHVHVNEPGRTEWEGFETATRAAAAGGVTTIVDMPLNSSPVTTTAAALKTKRAAAAGKAWVDVAFWGGVVPGNLSELGPMLDLGAAGFKAFLIDSGIDEFPAVGEADLRPAMKMLASRGAPLLVHAELGPCAEHGGDARRYATYLASRPKAMENAAVELMIRLCRETGCRVHIVHLSSAEAVEPLARARREGLPITAETCPHYLFFDADEVPDGRTDFKCSPPIREHANRERLWAALKDGTIGLVVSDHSPCVPELKNLEGGDFMSAWGGIASLQLSLAAVWTEARRRGFGVADVARWMSERPAALAGLAAKGALAPGRDADVVVWNPEAETDVDPAALRHRHKQTPYAGRKLAGAVEAVYLRGRQVFDREGFGPRPEGELLTARTHELHRAA